MIISLEYEGRHIDIDTKEEYPTDIYATEEDHLTVLYEHLRDLGVPVEESDRLFPEFKHLHPPITLKNLPSARFTLEGVVLHYSKTVTTKVIPITDNTNLTVRYKED